MFIIIIGVVIVVVIPLFYYFENKRVTRLKNEKAEGRWDFIDREYLPYLASHKEPVQTITGLSFSIYDGFDTWTGIPGVLHYNPAGIYCELESTMQGAPTEIFAWGKDKPSRFSAAQSYAFHSVEMKGEDTVVLNLKKVDRRDADYTLKMRNASAELYSELKRVMGPNAL
jgi:hypothetical protein